MLILVFIAGFVIIFNIMGYIRKYYPIRGRFGVAIVYLLISAICFSYELNLAGWLLFAASLMVIIELKIYEFRVKDTDRSIKEFEDEQERLSEKLKDRNKKK